LSGDNLIWKAVRDIVPIETTKEASLVVMEHHANKQIAGLKKQAALLVEQVEEIKGRVLLARLISGAEYSFSPVMLKEYYLYRHKTQPWQMEKFTLTLIAPDEWPENAEIPYGDCVATVRQLGDSTWEEIVKQQQQSETN
jgi:hypothetical protein|tara:strand:- start:160 stop:579 length:420 start_codon:yes stop_codon:yes gene_type:complete